MKIGEAAAVVPAPSTARSLRSRPRGVEGLRQGWLLDRRLRRGHVPELRREEPERRALGRGRPDHGRARRRLPRIQVRPALRPEHRDRVRERRRRLGQGRRGGGRVRLHRLHALAGLQRAARASSSSRWAWSTSSTSRRRFSASAGPTSRTSSFRRPGARSGSAPTATAGPLTYRGYVVNGLNAAGYSADEGIREGSQEGSEALAKNWAFTGRAGLHGVCPAFSSAHPSSPATRGRGT